MKLPNTPLWFNISLAFVLSALTLGAQAPTDNPVASHYAGAEGYPAWTDQIRWDQVINMAAYGEPGMSEFEKFEAARDALHAIGGGVLYYPAGVYDFSDAPMDGPDGRGLMLKSGVVIRGAEPVGVSDASDSGYALPTRFEFGFTERVGTGVTPTGETPRDWNLIGLQPDTANGETLAQVSRVGIVHVHLVGATVFWGFALDWAGATTYAASGAWKASLVKPAWADRVANGQFPLDYFAGSGSSRSYVGAGSGRMVFGCILQDAAAVNNVYREGRADPMNFGNDGYWLQKFGARIQVYGSDVLIANNRLPKSTRGFFYRQTVGNNPTQSNTTGSWTNTEATVYFDYNYSTAIDLNKELLNPYGNKEAGYFAERAVVRDNWVYNHGRKGYNLSGKWVEIRNNTNQRDYLGTTVPSGSGPTSGQTYYLTLDGYVQAKPGGPGDISDTLSRAFDLAGGPLWIHENKYGGAYGSTQSLGNDGEGILCQAHGGTQLVSWAVTYNNGQDGYMAGYDVNLSGALFGWNQTVGPIGLHPNKPASMLDTAIVNNVGGYAAASDARALSSDPGEPLLAPGNVAATVTGDHVVVTWTDGDDKETGYRVERSIDSGEWAVIAYRPRQAGEAGTSNPAAWHDVSAPRGLELRYRVRPTNWNDDGAVVSAASAPVMIPSLQSTRTAVDPQQLIPQDPAWEAGYQTRVGQLVNAQTWSIGSGAGDTDTGKRDWPALLGQMWKVKDNAASLQNYINNEGMRLINSQYAGSFYKAFSVPGYNQFYFHFKDYSATVGLNAAQEAAARGIREWSYLTREDNRMDPIYGQTEFNSENFNWMARLGGLQWAFELPDTDLGDFQYNWQAGQPKGMARAYFRDYMDNWTRALFNAGRVEWNAVIYWGYTFNPVLVLYDHPPVDPADAGYTDKVRNQARAGADWMVLESALHYLDGFTGGPGSRDKNTPYRPYTGSTWPFAYLYFADDENMPSYDLATMQANMDRNMVGWFPWSDYRPLNVIKSIAQRDFALPVEIQSAKPFYHLDHDNYAPWAGEGSYAAWKANKAAEEQAHRTGFRYEFETIYMDTHYLLASLATHRPNGSIGTFSEQTLFRLLVEGTDSGAVQVFGNTGFSIYPARRDPYEQIAQYGNVMMRVTKNPNASKNAFWFAVPTAANRVSDGNRLYVDMGNGVYFAVLPLGAPSLTVGAYTTDSTVDYQKATWAYGSDQLAAVVMEVGTQADHGSFAQFQATLGALDVTNPAANEVEYTASDGKHLRMQWTGLVNDYPMTENGGYILSTAGTIPRTWRDGAEVNYEAWNSYEVVHGAEIVHQEWGGGLLRLAAGGEAVEIEVDPVTAEVTYYSAPLQSNLPTVSIEGIDTMGAEAPLDTLLFRIARDGPTSLPLEVAVAFTGEAESADYTTEPELSAGSVVIPAGAASVDVTLTPIDDGINEPDESVVLTVLSSGSYRRSSPPRASGVITGLPVVNLTGTSNASEAGSNGSFTLTRAGNTDAPLGVQFQLSGTAIGGSDYSVTGAATYNATTGSGSLTFAAGQSSRTLTIVPVNDDELEGDESVVFNLLAGDGYVPGATSAATLQIIDNEVPPEPTFLAEKFDASRGAFDLQNKRLTFAWNGYGYSGFLEDITAFETDIAATGTLLNLSNDDNERVTLPSGTTVPFHGTDYPSFFVSSNGCITFNAGESGNYNAISYHFMRIRISALFVNLRIEDGGQIRWQPFADKVVVQYQAVRDLATGSANTFQVELYFDGRIRISWLAVGAQYPLVGLSNGSYDSATFEQTDFSAWPGPPEPQTPLQQWLAGYFSATEIAAGIADPHADAELQPDGVPNLLEYALAMDPRARDAHLAQVAAHIVESAGTPSLEITFRRNPAATDLQFLLEASSGLAAGQWTIVTPDSSAPATPDTDGTPRHTFRMNLGDEPAFYRVRIQPAP